MKDPIFSKMYLLEIFREDRQQAMSLTFSRLFASKMATCQKQGGDACIGLCNLNVCNKHSCAAKSLFLLLLFFSSFFLGGGSYRMKQVKKFSFMKYGII